ncbi:MAG: glycosyltransferase [Nanoarchaeota archaeon]|nr:glycosyltransferase [Nanoarchaeota archaeon]
MLELSWEVCNKVGGIYTVVTSKAELMKHSFKEYYLVGPYTSKADDFSPEETPAHLLPAFEALSKEGIKCHFGVWRIKGDPHAILLDFSGIVPRKNDLKKRYWEAYKVDSLRTGWDFEEPMLWSTAAGMLAEEMAKTIPKLSIHCHEWMSGFALLHTKQVKAPVATVFTTHATMLGRAIAGSNRDLYALLPTINADEMAYTLGVESKHQVERACAQTTDIFTTVSEITGMEAEKLLGRKPEVLVHNGLDIDKFPTIEDTSIRHIAAREFIREFLTYHFFPYYHFELDHHLTYFILARYEFRNKGIDLFIQALGKVNERLKAEHSKRTISVFFWIPARNSGIKTEFLENKNFLRHIKHLVEAEKEEIIDRIVTMIVSQEKMTVPAILSEEAYERLRQNAHHFRRSGDPPLSTHHIDEEHDDMAVACRRYGLNNREDDRVKVILYPVYLDGSDGLLNLSSEDALSGCHLGVFPSYYEPWGYTPLESAAYGVPAVTTDMAGFGRFIAPHADKGGIFILKRMNRPNEEAVEDLFRILYDFAMLDHKDRVRNKQQAKELSALADWSKLIQNYLTAHTLAAAKARGTP